MAVKYVTEAFVFGKEDRSDADRMFSVFTRDFGRLEVFGKAIRNINSKLRGGIDIFSFCQIEFIQGRRRKTMTDALALEKCGAIASDPGKFEVAQKISQVLADFIKGQELDSHIWDLVTQTFQKLNGAPNLNNRLLYYYFFWHFVSLLGYRPELSVCAACHGALNPQTLYFSYKAGGAVCVTCQAKEHPAIKTNADAVKMLRLLLAGDWGILEKVKLVPASKKMVQEISDGYRTYLASIISTKYHED